MSDSKHAKFFRDVLGSRSLTAIGYMAEDELKSATGEEREKIRAIYETNLLDEAWAIAHEELGEVEEAAVLRKWLAERSSLKTSS